MPLFNPKTINNALTAFDWKPNAAEIAAAKDWSARAADPHFDAQNESQLEQEFNRVILQKALGYVAPAPGVHGTMQVKQHVPGGTIVDVALGSFSDGRATVVAPLELKGPKVPLDRIMPGRAKTPVQQAWDYAMDTPGARWVVVSNMKELRLYAFGYGRQSYESFDLRKLAQPEEFRRLRLLLGAERLLTGATSDLLTRSAQADRDVTNQLYRDYRELRAQLIQFVIDQRPKIDTETRIRVVQTVLDRILFIAFAENKSLLPTHSLSRAIEYRDPFYPRPKWEQVLKLFEWIDKGAPPNNIPRYNGGLFAQDSLIDTLGLPDELVDRFKLITDYDFASEVSVTVLGHIFEQSITDIENEKAAAGLEAPPPVPKKKREGVVYTPDFITQFIVEQTVGRQLNEIRDALLSKYGKRDTAGVLRWKNKTTAEAEYWAAYLERLASLRILDPACGSGAFLIAAFNFLHAEQRRVRDRLSELQPGLLTYASPNADVEIITNNLFGVDVNAESVEITKLALWLQTAKRDRALESLDGNILHGNSLVNDAQFHARPFEWSSAFPQLAADGGRFDIVLGNPPYVRMEMLKQIKAHLQSRFAVATDRADLYAYFFELGVDLLKPGGRLGFISSSTFFRTGSGKLLRSFLAEKSEVECVVDFGELQVFEGVTTYPAIVTLRKGDHAATGSLQYLNVRDLPDDLAKMFEEQSRSMPRARLTSGTWRFESDMLDAVRQKISAGRPTLTEVFGAPLYGIKTGLNDAFVITRQERDKIVLRASETRGDRSADLLKPFLIGENLKRWRVESDDLWIVYTPKNSVDIGDFRALYDHLEPYRDRLEARATKQNWWELQQAQAAYQPHFETPKLIWPHFQSRGSFSIELQPRYLNNKCFFFPQTNYALLAFLNSKLAWFCLTSVARVKRGGYIEAEAQYVGALPAAFEDDDPELSVSALTATQLQKELSSLAKSVGHRLHDLSRSVSLSGALDAWPLQSFADLQQTLEKRFKVSIPIKARDEWEAWYEEKSEEARAISENIAAAEANIDARVYQLFELTPTEIAAVENALVVATPALNLEGYEAISAVEGLQLTPEARARLAGSQRIALRKI
ncbi:TaqI restriction endonuclease [Sinorhizobium medicae]|uniref:Eco57I restriction-modification methylase domain-containing protein n=1 Tax=Sinorhizobium medicae TaxID=110321 RepID=UPI0011A82A4D|nr:N-6 DNA methylase [Sinorhizobium medicae]TWA26363.1 TaqI restriction endonuclease [Sinorhizobium medicae]